MKLLKTGEDSLEGLQTYGNVAAPKLRSVSMQVHYLIVVPDCAMLHLTCRMPSLSSQSTEINQTCMWGNTGLDPGWIETWNSAGDPLCVGTC